MESGKILVARDGASAFLKVAGKGSFQNAPLVKTFYGELLKQNVDHFVIDLAECSYMDSTFLGTLAGLGLRIRELGHGRLLLRQASERNLELLQNLGLDRLFTVEHNQPAPASPAMQELAGSETTKNESGRHMLEAHETLIQIDPGNASKFKDVVAYLREDLGKESLE